jgi:hypothetical protein
MRTIHRYGKIEDILEKIGHAGRGQIMNFYIYSYKRINNLVDEQKADETNSFTDLHYANQHCSTHKVFDVFTSRCLATAFNSGDSSASALTSPAASDRLTSNPRQLAG